MRKALVIVGALVVLGALVVSAFAGGIVVGRVSRGTGTTPADGMGPPSSVLEESAAESLEATPDVPPTPEPEDVASVQSTPDTLDTTDRRPAPDFNYDLLRDVLEILAEQYYGELPDGHALAYGAVRGMLTALDDPYTSFIEPRISAILQEDATGEFEGIGAMVRMREDGYLEIASLIPNQPAEAAGVLPGDLIVGVGDTSIVGLGLYEAISYIRGPADTEAELEIIRPGIQERIYITVVRARIDIPIVESRLLDDDIAYLSLSEFDAMAAERVETTLAELLDGNPRGLILDLRNNPGGWLNQAIAVADLFLDEGIVAIQRDSLGNEQRFPSGDGDIGEAIPLVVLINAGSASASEIVAGALQDRGRATLIGTQTLGKGSVQLPNNLEDGSQLRVTIARWYTPGEQPLHGSGLTPDFEVAFSMEMPPDEDPQLDAAVAYLLGESIE